MIVIGSGPKLITPKAFAESLSVSPLRFHLEVPLPEHDGWYMFFVFCPILDTKKRVKMNILVSIWQPILKLLFFILHTPSCLDYITLGKFTDVS